MAATNYTPIQLYYSSTASAAPTSGNLANGELAINITDGKLYYKDNGGVVQVLATKGAGTIGGSTTQIQYNNAGALAGSASMTFNSGTNVTTLTTLNLTNALGAIYGGTAQSAYAQGDVLYASATNTLSKLGIGTVNYILTSTGSVPQWVAPTSITVNTATNLAGGAGGSVPYQSAVDTTTFLAIGAANRVMTSSGTVPQWVTALTGLTGVSSSSITDTGLTSGRVTYASTGGLLADSTNLTFNGTTLSAGGFSTTGLSTLVKTVTIGDSNFNGAAVFAAATPAKLYMGTGTVTDVTSAASATNTTGAIASLAITPIAATNTAVTYTNASTLYIAGAPSAGTNITITNPYSLYVAAGAAYFGGAVTVAGSLSLAAVTVTSLTDSGLTSGRVTYAGTGGLLQDSANMTFNGTTLTVAGFSNTGNTILGDASADTVTVNGTITSNLIFTDNTYDIGASGATRPRNLYLSNSARVGTGGVIVDSAGNAAYTSAKGLVVNYTGSSTSLVVPIGFSWSSSTSSTDPYWGIGLIPTNYSSGTAALGFYVAGAEYGRFTGAGLSVSGALSATSTISTTIGGKTASFDAAGNSIYSSYNDATRTWRTGVGITVAGRYSIYDVTGSNEMVGVNSVGSTLQNFAGHALTPVLYINNGYGVTGDTTACIRMNLNSSSGGGYIWGYSGDTTWAHNMEYVALTGSVARATTASQIQQTGGNITFFTNTGLTAGNTFTPSEAARFDTSQRLLIGATSSTGANAKLVIGAGNLSTNGVIVANTANGTYPGLTLSNWTGSATTNGPYIVFDNSSVGGWAIGSGNGVNTFEIATTWGTPFVRIDVNAIAFFNTTDTNVTTGGNVILGPNATSSPRLITGHATGTASGNEYAAYKYAGTTIGSITQSGTTAVLFNVTSDYRLKTVIGPVADAGQRIDALRPVEYTWNSDGSRTRGFLAHQFQEVYAGSVSGNKDAVDADGKPVYQAMQASTSEVIADLVAEIQSLRARLATLESK